MHSSQDLDRRSIADSDVDRSRQLLVLVSHNVAGPAPRRGCSKAGASLTERADGLG